MTEQNSKGPDHHWRIGAYRFALFRWECDAHGRGVGGRRTPIGAFFALRRWLREPLSPVDQP